MQRISYSLTVVAADIGFPVSNQSTVVVNITIFPFLKPELDRCYYGEIHENNFINAVILQITGTPFGTAADIGQFEYVLSGPDTASFTIQALGNNSAILKAG